VWWRVVVISVEQGYNCARCIVDSDGRYHSKVLPGFWLCVDWLWADELPDSLFAFAEIANLPAEVVQALRSLQR